MRLSATQISTWLDCRRKWSFLYQDGLQPEPGKASALGTDVHAQLETYLTGGTLDYTRESGYIAEVAIPYLPQPSKELEVEHEFLLVSPKHRYAGVIDCRKGPCVIDHKTTSDLKWAKTPEDLLLDVQAILYATTTFVSLPKARDVLLHWGYVTTKKPYKAHPVYQTTTREHAEREFSIIEQVADEIEKDVGVPSLELEPSPEACEKYGGCPFRYRCNLSPMDRMRSIMSNNSESLISFLRAKRAINPPPMSSIVDEPVHHPPVEEPTAVEAPRETVPETPVAKRDTTPAPAPTKEKAEKKPIDTLYVNCFPVGNKKHESFEVLIEKAKALVEEGWKVADYRFIEFGQGPGVLLQAFRAVVTPGRDVVVMHSYTPEAMACISWMLANCMRIVQGVK